MTFSSTQSHLPFEETNTWQKTEKQAAVLAKQGEVLEGTFGLCLIGNIIHYGGVMKLSPKRQLDDGRFEVYLFEQATLRKLVSVAARGIVSDLRKACRLETARTVKVTAASPVAYQVDGDYRGETPVDFEVTGRRFRVLVP